MSKVTTEMEVALIVGAIVIGYIAIKGIRGAAAGAAGAIVDAASGAVTGATDAAGQAVGLPALSDITTDASVARWIIDNPEGGEFAASKWSSLAAFTKAQFMDAGSGIAPPYGSKIAHVFPGYSGVVGTW